MRIKWLSKVVLIGKTDLKYYIQTHRRKYANVVNMHCNYGKTSLYLPVSALWYHTRTNIIHHH